MVPPLIALEEHYDSQLFKGDALHDNMPPQLNKKLHDLGDIRIKDLDNGKCGLQVISHVGGATPVKECMESNDRLAAACKKYPGRFAGWANLPMQDPDAAVQELDRTVTDLGFVGALINNHTEDGSLYDDERYWPVFARAVELDVPIYIHPMYPAPNLEDHYKGNFSPAAGIMMSTSGWGWHSETGLHILRLFAAGLFDRHPKLKIVIGHSTYINGQKGNSNHVDATWSLTWGQRRSFAHGRLRLRLLLTLSRITFSGGVDTAHVRSDLSWNAELGQV